MAERIPVILDTDIGGDIDDTWALAMLLKSPELDVRLVVSDTGNTVYRAKIIARLLEVAGRTDVPVGVGLNADPDAAGPQQPWVADYDLGGYPGTVHEDGVEATARAIEAAEGPATLIAIGPVTNIAELLRRRDDLAGRTDFVGMHGSIARHHRGGEGPIAEYNVRQDVAAAQSVLAAGWRSTTVTPLDTCGQVVLDGELYRRVAESEEPVARAVIENYLIWRTRGGKEQPAPPTESSILFDTVAVHLAHTTRHLRMETMPLRVDDRGFTVRDEAGTPMSVAIEWADLAAYRRELTDRMCAGVVR
jgi:inosine-uridine nucleoside N-ribohydrolase